MAERLEAAERALGIDPPPREMDEREESLTSSVSFYKRLDEEMKDLAYKAWQGVFDESKEGAK